MRVGLFGTGEMAATHLRAWRKLAVDVVVCSRSPGRAAEFARTHEVEALADPDRLLDLVELVDVCTPTDTHAELVYRAAAAGRHVICEKPLTRDYETGRSMLAACRAAGVWLFVGHTLRFVPAYADARERVRAGEIGPPRRLRLVRSGGLPSSPWYAEPDRSGGVLVDLAIHDLDYARWVAGEVVAVDAGVSTGPDGAPPIRGEVRLTHAGGAETEVVVVWESPGTPYRSSGEIHGEHGVVRIDPDSDADPDADPHTEQMAEFLAALEDGTEPRVTAEDGLAALAIGLDAERSATGHA